MTGSDAPEFQLIRYFKKHLNVARRTRALLRSHHRQDIAWIEDVFSSPQMGVVSSFSFGEGKGVLKGVLAGCGVPRFYVSPAKWKADLRISAEKAIAKRQSWKLFPNCKRVLSSSGKAEAGLISLWGALSGSIDLNSLKVITPIETIKKLTRPSSPLSDTHKHSTLVDPSL
jgi:hypothetical protein